MPDSLYHHIHKDIWNLLKKQRRVDEQYYAYTQTEPAAMHKSTRMVDSL